MVQPIANAYTRKQELNAAQHQADLAAVQASAERQADLIKQGRADDAAWELASLAAAKSWMRSYELIVLSVPAVLCFFGPHYAQIVKDGFAALAQCPLWFQGMLGTVFMANYGIRTWRRNQSDT